MTQDTSIVSVALARTTEHVESHIENTSNYGVDITEYDYETIKHPEEENVEYGRVTSIIHEDEIKSMFETDPYAERRETMKKLTALLG